jgi:hypothetical protein
MSIDFKDGFVYGRAGLGIIFNSLELSQSLKPSALGSMDIHGAFKGTGTGFVVGVGGGIFLTPNFSLNGDINYRSANVEKVKDGSGHVLQWKEETNMLDLHSDTDVKRTGYSLVPVNFGGIQVTMGAAVHFSLW